jgi:hypothetical protein
LIVLVDQNNGLRIDSKRLTANFNGFFVALERKSMDLALRLTFGVNVRKVEISGRGSVTTSLLFITQNGQKTARATIVSSIQKHDSHLPHLA